MYLLTPIVIICVCLILLGVIVTRKFVYLRRLDPGAVKNGPAGFADFSYEMFPEIAAVWTRIFHRENFVKILAEAEKALRKVRIIFMRLDTLMHDLIRSVRTKTKEQEKILEAEEYQSSDKPDEAGESDMVADPREEEQRLIMEIAKDPRNAQLYKKLGVNYMRLNEIDDARQSFEKALKLDPEDVLVQNRLRRLLKK